MRAEPADTRSERERRRLARLVFAFYLALLGEGILRKWLLPSASNALVFLRDPLMAAILALYLRRGPARNSRVPLALGAAAGLALLLCAGCQAFTTDVPAVVLLAGLRNYVLFAPLCLVIRDCFVAEDYRGWLRLNLWIAPAVGALVAIQYVSPPGAAINAVPGGGNDGVFLLVDNVVRPYGVFSFVLGHSAFAGWMSGVALAVLVARRRFGFGVIPVALGIAGIAAMAAFSGSRTCVLLVLSGVGVFGGAAAACGPPRVKAAGLAATLAMMGVGVAVLVVVPSVSANLMERQNAAVASEGALGDRLAQVLTDFTGEMSRAPLFGEGLGAGTNIAAYLSTGRTDHVLAEYELTRIVQELGPLFGPFYILVRWGFLAWVAVMALGAAARGNLQPACYLGFLIPIFLAHDITLQNTMIGIGWFAAGIALSAERVGAQVVVAPVAATRLRLAGASP